MSVFLPSGHVLQVGALFDDIMVFSYLTFWAVNIIFKFDVFEKYGGLSYSCHLLWRRGSGNIHRIGLSILHIAA